MTKIDIEKANEIRLLLRNTMTKEGLSNPPPDVWKMIKEFVEKKRYKYRCADKWEKDFKPIYNLKKQIIKKELGNLKKSK